MINYGYFRHRFDAHNNAKLNNVVDEMGVVAYGYYFTLIEIYGQKYSQTDNKEVTIHMRTIANVWRKRIDNCKKVLTKLQLSGLLNVTFNDSTCTLDIPNFAKYYGSYKKTISVERANKSKEKESKEKENKVNKTDHENVINLKISETHLIQAWNDCFMKTDKMYRGFSFGAGVHRDNFINATGYLPEINDWINVFLKIKENEGLMKSGWCNLLHVINYDKIIEIQNGKFDWMIEKEKESITNASKIKENIIMQAITSGASKISECEILKGNDSEIEFIINNGGLMQLGAMNNFELNKIINNAK